MTGKSSEYNFLIFKKMFVKFTFTIIFCIYTYNTIENNYTHATIRSQ